MKKNKKEYTLKNIWAYIQGNFRYYCYYNGLKFLIPKYIKQQIDWRIKIMNGNCFSNGSCELCGCSTTALQMANKSCDRPCYPPMLNRKQWDVFHKGMTISRKKVLWGYERRYLPGKQVEHIIYKDCRKVHSKILNYEN